MKTVNSFLLTIGSTSALLDFDIWGNKDKEVDQKYAKYLSDHNKSYGTKEEYEFRKALFAEKELKINEWNSQGNTHVIGHNKFSDWTKEEF